ncbi:MAG: hypothetical protein WC551_11120 [Patescibacteria group bacterium]
METFELNQRVQIKATGVVGVVNAIFDSTNCERQFRVQFYDNTGRPCDYYYFASQIQAFE